MPQTWENIPDTWALGRLEGNGKEHSSADCCPAVAWSLREGPGQMLGRDSIFLGVRPASPHTYVHRHMPLLKPGHGSVEGTLLVLFTQYPLLSSGRSTPSLLTGHTLSP